MEEVRKGLKALKGMSTPQEDHLTWMSESSQRLCYQPKKTHVLESGPGTYVADMQLSLHVDPPTPEPEVLPKAIV